MKVYRSRGVASDILNFGNDFIFQVIPNTTGVVKLDPNTFLEVVNRDVLNTTDEIKTPATQL
jgi:hypothetical protein